ncbi:MAG: desulfoferrodoxin [Clostridiales bacterium]|nr:desulfoferrodoxin [Clostridiales bacterium]
MKEPTFYICRHCGNLAAMIQDVGVKMHCCGEKMEALIPNTVEAATEKHIPVVTLDSKQVTVTVGSVLHPMQEEHSIQWIYLQTEQGIQCKELKPGDAPEAVFALTEGDSPIAAYAYCNLHGLWKADIVK